MASLVITWMQYESVHTHNTTKGCAISTINFTNISLFFILYFSFNYEMLVASASLPGSLIHWFSHNTLSTIFWVFLFLKKHFILFFVWFWTTNFVFFFLLPPKPFVFDVWVMANAIRLGGYMQFNYMTLTTSKHIECVTGSGEKQLLVDGGNKYTHTHNSIGDIGDKFVAYQIYPSV